MSFPRYSKYKDSGVEWLGEVPEHWRVLSLAKITVDRCDGPFGSGLKSEHYTDSGVRVIRLQNIRSEGFNGDDAAFIDADYYRTELNGHDVMGGDVLIAGLGDDNHPVGRACVAPAGIEPAMVKADCFRFRLDVSQVAPAFVATQLCAGAVADAGILSSGTTRSRIPLSVTSMRKVAIPPCDEQTQIASFLNRETAKIDGLVGEQLRLIELLKEKRQAVISHAVIKGLNPHAPMKPSGIEWLGDLPEHWQVRRVKSVSGFITSGPRGWSERISEKGSLFVQSGDLNNFLEIEFSGSKRVQVDQDAEAVRTRLCDGDIVVCVTGAKTGNVAVCAAVSESAYVNQHLCLIRPTQDILPIFLGLLLKSKLGQTYFELSQYGVKQGLSLEDVKGSPVLLPPLAEQIAILAYINIETAKLDALTAEAQRAIDLLHERRTALISAAVTGKIDVRRLAESEAA